MYIDNENILCVCLSVYIHLDLSDSHEACLCIFDDTNSYRGKVKNVEHLAEVCS